MLTIKPKLNDTKNVKIALTKTKLKKKIWLLFINLEKFLIIYLYFSNYNVYT